MTSFITDPKFRKGRVTAARRLMHATGSSTSLTLTGLRSWQKAALSPRSAARLERDIRVVERLERMRTRFAEMVTLSNEGIGLVVKHLDTLSPETKKALGIRN